MDMQMCMKDYPDLYGNKDPMDVEDEEEILNESKQEKTIEKAEENRWLKMGQVFIFYFIGMASLHTKLTCI